LKIAKEIFNVDLKDHYKGHILTHIQKQKVIEMDVYGNELKFNDGITWVEIIPVGGSVTIAENPKQTTSGDASGELKSNTKLKTSDEKTKISGEIKK
jgi:hypothetical protein